MDGEIKMTGSGHFMDALGFGNIEVVLICEQVIV